MRAKGFDKMSFIMKDAPPVGASCTSCPKGTFVYTHGSHCCNFDVDREDSPITFTSNNCKDGSYVECPKGAVDGNCCDPSANNDAFKEGTSNKVASWAECKQQCLDTTLCAHVNYCSDGSGSRVGECWLGAANTATKTGCATELYAEKAGNPHHIDGWTPETLCPLLVTHKSCYKVGRSHLGQQASPTLVRPFN